MILFFGDRNKYHVANGVTIVLALNRISALFDLNFGNYALSYMYAYFGCLSSVMGSFTEIYGRNFRIYHLEVLKNGYKLCINWRLDFMQTNLLLLDVFRKVLSLIRFANDPYTLYNRLNPSRLTGFWKTWKHANRGKMQCCAPLVISKATFMKTAIKPKFQCCNWLVYYKMCSFQVQLNLH